MSQQQIQIILDQLTKLEEKIDANAATTNKIVGGLVLAGVIVGAVGVFM